VPSAEDLPARVSGVLAVLFLVFNEGYLATGPDTDPVRHELTAEAIRLTRLIAVLLPDDGEAAGLLALMLLTASRRPAGVSAARRWHWRPSTVSSTRLPAITPTTPHAPTCCAGWAGARNRARPTTRPSTSRATPPRSPT